MSSLPSPVNSARLYVNWYKFITTVPLNNIKQACKELKTELCRKIEAVAKYIFTHEYAIGMNFYDYIDHSFICLFPYISNQVELTFLIQKIAIVCFTEECFVDIKEEEALTALVGENREIILFIENEMKRLSKIFCEMSHEFSKTTACIPQDVFEKTHSKEDISWENQYAVFIQIMTELPNYLADHCQDKELSKIIRLAGHYFFRKFDGKESMKNFMNDRIKYYQNAGIVARDTIEKTYSIESRKHLLKLYRENIGRITNDSEFVQIVSDKKEQILAIISLELSDLEDQITLAESSLIKPEIDKKEND